MGTSDSNEGEHVVPGRRILVFASHFHPHVGGLERFCLEFWKRFVARGWSVTLITSATGDAPARESIDGIAVVRLPVVNTFQGRFPLPMPSPAFFRALSSALDPAPDLIVTNTRFFFTSVLGIFAGRRLQRPVLHIDHGSGFVDLGHPVLTKCAELFDRRVGGWVLKSADRVVGVSGSVNEFVRGLGAQPAGVIHNGVDAALYRGARPTLRDELRLAPSSILIVFVGRLLEEKGVRVLLDAFEALDTDARMHLAIIGDGPMLETAQRRADGQQRIHVLGERNAEQVREALASADVFVHPSHYPEGLPTAVLEAAASGCAIVATPAGGTPEIIDGPERGVLVPPRDPIALAAALTQLAGDDALRSRLGAAAARRVAERFDWDRIVQAAEAEVRALITHGRAAPGGRAPGLDSRAAGGP